MNKLESKKHREDIYEDLDVLVSKNRDMYPDFADKMHVIGCLQAEVNDLYSAKELHTLEHELFQIAAIATRAILQIRDRSTNPFNCRG